MRRQTTPTPVVDVQMSRALKALAAGKPVTQAIRAARIRPRTFYYRWNRILSSADAPRGLTA